MHHHAKCYQYHLNGCGDNEFFHLQLAFLDFQISVFFVASLVWRVSAHTITVPNFITSGQLVAEILRVIFSKWWPSAILDFKNSNILMDFIDERPDMCQCGNSKSVKWLM